jgi:4-hydroxy-tetrahydrodipicolinate reductase
MKIALIGYGKMGKEIEQIAQERGHEITVKAGREQLKKQDLPGLQQADAAIEFSVPESAYANVLRCFDADVPVVCGTTGWLEQMEIVKTLSLHSGKAFFYASNYSIGVNIFFQMNRYLARMMEKYDSYNPSLEEIHHIHKKDSPSGTGITLAEDLLREISRKHHWKEGLGTDPSVLEIISKREGEVPGTHRVKYSSVIDDIEISHVAHNRKGFALGAVLAAEWIQGKKGVFGMNDMLGFDK